VEHAKKANAEMIVASTQSKKGVTRFLFGSFAETLVLQSEIPVLLVSPKTAPARKFRHIFFPTDLTDKSRQVFEGAIALAIAHKAKLTLFHKVEYLNEYSVAAFVPPINQEYLRSDLQRRKAELTGLAEQARARGVKVDIVLDSKVRSIVDSIVSAAKRGKADLIAMASQTGPVATALLGSVTRQLLRSATCPVWVVHPSGPGEINVNRDVHRPNEYIPNARARAGQAR
jgi:nucleotide-binding universal stress UspA family protein